MKNIPEFTEQEVQAVVGSFKKGMAGEGNGIKAEDTTRRSPA